MKPECQALGDSSRSSSKQKFFLLFPFFEGYFCLPVSGSEFKIRNKLNKSRSYSDLVHRY
jgi:hypothetical protein